MIDIGKQLVDVPCEQCKRKFQVTLAKVAREETVNCPSCRQQIKLVDKGNSVKNSIRNGNKALSDFEKTLKKLFR